MSLLLDVLMDVNLVEYLYVKNAAEENLDLIEQMGLINVQDIWKIRISKTVVLFSHLIKLKDNNGRIDFLIIFFI
jgi:hypothetical protein